MAEVDRVIGVVMRDEDRRPVVGAQAGLHHLHADARAGVDQEMRGAAERDERGRAAPLGIGRWSTGAEKDRAHGATGCYQRSRWR